jgi:protein SCO1/2
MTPHARSRPRRLGVVFVALVLLLSGCAGASSSAGNPVEVDSSPSALHGTAIGKPYPLPSQRFTDTRGRAYVPAHDATAPVTLVFFGYTHCPDVCNVVLANVAAALRRTEQGVRDDTQLLFVTTDPARDTDAVMRRYLDRFDPSYVGLRAPVATTKARRSATARRPSCGRPRRRWPTCAPTSPRSPPGRNRRGLRGARGVVHAALLPA